MLHAVQMNEAEAGGLTAEGYDTINLVKQIVSLGTRNVCVTRGAGGCTFYCAEKKEPVAGDIPGVPVAGQSDTTGCGDVFGAAYCASFVHNNDAKAAAQFANRVAAAKAGLLGSNGLAALSAYRITSGEEAPS